MIAQMPATKASPRTMPRKMGLACRYPFNPPCRTSRNLNNQPKKMENQMLFIGNWPGVTNPIGCSGHQTNRYCMLHKPNIIRLPMATKLICCQLVSCGFTKNRSSSRKGSRGEIVWIQDRHSRSSRISLTYTTATEKPESMAWPWLKKKLLAWKKVHFRLNLIISYRLHGRL